VNETLCRALLQARLTEEDVAARLQVDPKTVRRWLEGRMPYLRHRWTLSALLGVDESDLWPQLRATRTRPEEVRAIYPHRDAVPRGVWLRLFGSAEHEIGMLDHSALFLAEDPEILTTLADRVGAGVRLRICLADPDVTAVEQRSPRDDGSADSIRAALALYESLPNGDVEVRLHGAILYHSIYRSDDQILVAQRVYGLPSGRAPLLRLGQPSGLGTTFLEECARIWAVAERKP